MRIDPEQISDSQRSDINKLYDEFLDDFRKVSKQSYMENYFRDEIGLSQEKIKNIDLEDLYENNERLAKKAEKAFKKDLKDFVEGEDFPLEAINSYTLMEDRVVDILADGANYRVDNINIDLNDYIIDKYNLESVESKDIEFDDLLRASPDPHEAKDWRERIDEISDTQQEPKNGFSLN